MLIPSKSGWAATPRNEVDAPRPRGDRCSLARLHHAFIANADLADQVDTDEVATLPHT